MLDNLTLDSSMRRHRRANKEIQTLFDDFKQWQDTHPFSLVPEIAEDRHKVTYIAKMKENPLLEKWAEDISSILHSYRSSLDNLAWELSQQSSNPPLTPEEEKGVYFPICTTVENFEKSKKRPWVSGLSDSLIGRLRLTQPFAAGVSVDSVLVWLNDMQNADKHRSLVSLHPTLDRIPFTLTGDWIHLEDEKGEPFEETDGQLFLDPANLAINDGMRICEIVTSQPVFKALEGSTPLAYDVMDSSGRRTDLESFLIALNNQTFATIACIKLGVMPPIVNGFVTFGP